jgi:hypothetical protein
MQAGDLAPTFSTLYPEILDPHIGEEQFRRLVDHVNAELIAAFGPFSARNWIDTVLSVATFWLWEDLGFTGVKKRLEKLESFLADWNRNVGLKEGIAIIPLRRTAYLNVSLLHLKPAKEVANIIAARLSNTRPADRHRPQSRLATAYKYDGSTSRGWRLRSISN